MLAMIAGREPTAALLPPVLRKATPPDASGADLTELALSTPIRRPFPLEHPADRNLHSTAAGAR